MSIRHIIVAALAASACAAHADVIQTPAANQSGFLSSWTTGNGTDVLNSGLFSGMNLIGGISHSESAKTAGSQATLAEVLYGKASASLGQGADGQTKLYFQQGIEGSYLLGAGHGILAAMLGDGVSVVGSADGVVVSKGQAGAMVTSSGGGGGGSTGGSGATPAASGGGGASGGGSTGGGSTGGGSTGGGSTGGGSTGGGSTGGGSTGGGSTGGGSTGGGGADGGAGGGGTTGGNGGGNAGDTTGGLPGAIVSHPSDAGPVLVTLPPTGTPGGQQPVDVPEPSSIALMLAGVLGAGGVLRRRKR